MAGAGGFAPPVGPSCDTLVKGARLTPFERGVRFSKDTGERRANGLRRGTGDQRRRQPHHGEPRLALQPRRPRRSATGWAACGWRPAARAPRRRSPRRWRGSRTRRRRREIASNVVTGPKGWAAYGAIDPGERTKALRRPGLRAPAGVHHLRRLAVPALARPGGEVRRRAGAEPGDGRLLRRRQAPDRRRRRAAGRSGTGAGRDRRGDRGRRRRDLDSGRAGRRALARPSGPRPDLARA